MRAADGFLALILLAWPSLGQAAAWHVDPAKSRLTAAVMQQGRMIEGAFERFAAEITFDPNRLDQAQIVVTVDLASFAMGDAQRDAIARSEEILAAGSNPTARYATTRITRLDGDRYQVEANLTLKGLARPVSHPATIVIDGDQARATGEATLLRLDYGVGARQFPGGDQLGLEVRVRFDVTATRG